MSTTIENTISVVDFEGDITNTPQITISSVVIDETQFDPVIVNSSSVIVPITREIIDPVIITIPS